MNYNRLNNLVGWAVFLIATIVYFMTIESTASLWDCGEYITAAYKLEVGHPPGAPLFMVLGRLFSFFAAPEDVAVWINRLSALSSSFTILFMYWSITLLGKKVLRRLNNEWTKGDQIAVVGAGVIGALAYTFSDSFWFSAVEGEVYAMSSLFTAAIFWAILKWDEEWSGIKSGEIVKTASPWRWLILIAFLFGLAIGVHLLGLLVVPSIAFVIYFNLYEKATLKGILLTGIIGVVALAFIQEGVIPGIISIASSFEVGGVNSFNLPFFTGTIFFFLLLIAAVVFGLRWAAKKVKPMVTTIIWSFVVLLIGYSSFAVIVIRSNANTPLDENDPENLATLYSYLKREQYGSWPILTGNYWNSLKEGEVLDANGQPRIQSTETWGNLTPTYLRRFVVQKNGEDVKAFKSEIDANAYAKANGPRFEVKEKYFCSNRKIKDHQVPKYSQSTFLPRMYYSSENPTDQKLVAYKNWSGYNPIEDKGTEIGRDGLRLPTFGENMRYMWDYQLDWMYWRYFMWNFAGRQNDIQGHGDNMRGNWKTGFDFLDASRIGKADTQPYYTQNNPANNSFYLFPLILGILGLIYHFYRAPKEAFVVFLTFLFTGLAIVVYLNQKPFEPRERDYAYAASFYAFAMWIGIGVLALYDIYKNFKRDEWKGFAVILGIFSTIVIFAGLISRSSTTLSTYMVILIGAGILAAIALLFQKVTKNQTVAAMGLTLVAAFAPYIMGQQGWNDHDRSGKTSARDLAENYLMSCADNSIIFTVGDNDTFPLWYLQEVEGKHTDKRVCNTSLFDTDWYTDQMKMKAYQSEPLPIKFREDQILMFEGGTDQAYFFSTYEMLARGANEGKVKEMIGEKIKNNTTEFLRAYTSFRAKGASAIASLKEKDASFAGELAKIKSTFNTPVENATPTTVVEMVRGIETIGQSYQAGMVEGDQNALNGLFQQLTEWEDSWAYMPLDKAMEYVRDDANMLNVEGNQLRVFPCKGFVVSVNKENALNSGIISADEKSKMAKTMRFAVQAVGITKSDLMILDIMANNDWKRALYFSSPGGTEIGMALYRAGHLRQNGMTWEISPIKIDPNEPLNAERMYDNLMTKYVYGKMNQADVLTDYYARRNTFTLRNSFGQLANYYLNQAQRERSYKENYGPIIKQLRASGQGKQADSLQTIISGADAKIATYNKKAISLVKRSLEVMPADIVLDYGEQANKITSVQDQMGNEVYVYGDGTLQTYVSILFRAGAKVEAEKLGAQVADQVESTIDFFLKNDEEFAARNSSDFCGAVGAYLEMYKAAKDGKFGNPSGTFFKRLEQKITALYNNELSRIYSQLRIKASDNEEIPGSNGLYTAGLMQLENSMNAAGMFYDYIVDQTEKSDKNNLPTDIAMDSLNQPLVTDSTLPAGTPMDSQNGIMNSSGIN